MKNWPSQIASIFLVFGSASAAQSAFICDRSEDETLFFSGGVIEFELITTGTLVLDTKTAGPTVVLLCDKAAGEEQASFTCPDHAGKVQVSLSRNGRVSAKCIPRSAPASDPAPEPDDETEEAEETGEGSNS